MPIPETEPLSEDEWVLRLIWCDYLTDKVPVPIAAKAFEPRKTETDGISVFRASCLDSHLDILKVIAEDKRSRYGIARLLVSDLQGIGLSVRAAPIQTVPGHGVFPELNIVAHNADKPRWKIIKDRLAELASSEIIHRPTTI